jgi:8-oxo-dGTP pyrophosphatase MutT (NUDIX family)
MLNFETLWKGKWVSVISPENAPYECLHEKDIVIVFPIITEIQEFGNFKAPISKIGIRKEFCPPYMVKDNSGEQLYYTVITGKLDKEGESKKDAALRELEEEAGVKFTDGDISKVFEDMPVCKSTDMRATLFVVEVDKYEKHKPEGDGTENEKKSETIWVTWNELSDILKKPNIDFLLLAVERLVSNHIHDINGRYYGGTKVASLQDRAGEPIIAELRPSPLGGIGVFALKDIPAGAPVFLFPDKQDDRHISKEELENMPEEEKQLLHTHAVVLPDGSWDVPFDPHRMHVVWYLNHSSNPNVFPDKDFNWFATRDIKKGEELLGDYNAWDAEGTKGFDVKTSSLSARCNFESDGATELNDGTYEGIMKGYNVHVSDKAFKTKDRGIRGTSNVKVEVKDKIAYVFLPNTKQAWQTNQIENGDIVIYNGRTYEVVNLGKGMWYNSDGDEIGYNMDPERCLVYDKDTELTRNVAIKDLRKIASQLIKITALEDDIYQLNDNEIPIDNEELNGILSSYVPPEKIEKVSQQLKQEKTVEIPLEKQADTGVVVDMYEVDYNPTDKPEATISQSLDRDKDLINETVIPNTDVSKVHMTVGNWRETLKVTSKHEPLTKQEYFEIESRFGRKRECSFSKDKDGYYCYTHRARSKSYKTIDNIPMKVFKFIESTS